MSDKKAAAPKKVAVAKKTSTKKTPPKKPQPPKDTKKYANDWNFEQMFSTLQNNIGTLCTGMSTLSQLMTSSDPYADFNSIGMLQSALAYQLQALHNLTGRFYDIEDHNPVPKESPNPVKSDLPAIGVPSDVKVPGLVFTPPGGKDGN